MVEAVHTLPVVALGMHGIALGDRWTSTAQPVWRSACKTLCALKLEVREFREGKKPKQMLNI